MNSLLKRSMGVLLAGLMAVAQIISGIAAAQITDTESPVVIHRQAESAGIAGDLQTFLARVSDDFEIDEVVLYYRQSDTGAFSQIPMRELLDTLGEYMIAVETTVTDYPGLQYYIEAVDTSGNRTNRGYSFAPIVLPLEAPATTPATTGQPQEILAPMVVSEAPEPVRKKSSGTAILLGLGALLLLGAVAGGSSGGSDGGSSGDSDTVTLTIVSDGPSAN